MANNKIHVIGAGLAGSEAAWQIAKRGVEVVLHEMRPTKKLPRTRQEISPSSFAVIHCGRQVCQMRSAS